MTQAVDYQEHLKTFVDTLKRDYKERLVNRHTQWPPCVTNKLIRLELIKSNTEQSSSDSLQNDESVKPTPLAYADLFKGDSDNQSVRKVIVEGDAGIGKTIFCSLVSEDWANDQLFQEFKLLLLLPLREEEIASVSSLSDLLKQVHRSDEVCSSVERYLAKNGDKMLIIADGWDELSESKRQKKSFLYHLLFGRMYRDIFVLVTSRRSASASLREDSNVHRFLEIRGFNKESIDEYIKSKFVNDQQNATRLIEQLESNPTVESICSVPLNCAIVCHLWHSFKNDFPTTMTELYSKILLSIVLRNLKRKTEYHGLNLPDFDALPGSIKSTWLMLCEFAFKGIVERKIVFTCGVEKFLCFGLLQCTKSLSVTGHSVSYNFLHLTFQEYLASFHLVKQPLEIQLEVLQANANSQHFKVVWRFFCGLAYTKGKLPALHHAAQLLDKSSLNFLHCAFEARDKGKIFSGTDDTLMGSYNAKSAYDCTAVIYAISNVQKCINANIRFKNSGIREKQVHALTNKLVIKSGKVYIKDLNLSGNQLTDICVCDLFKRASDSFQPLERLSLYGIRKPGMGSEVIRSITDILGKSSPYCLQQLVLSHNPLGSSGFSVLEGAIRDGFLANLCKLSLTGCLTNDENENGRLLSSFCNALSTCCGSLTYLSLSGNKLGVPGALAIGAALPQLSAHQKENAGNKDHFGLYLNETCLGDEGVKALTQSFEGTCHLRGLEMRTNSIHVSGISSLVDSVCSGKIIIEEEILHGLIVDNNPLGLDGVEVLGNLISSHHYHSDSISLKRCQLTTSRDGLLNSETVKNQLYKMPQSNSVTWLILNHNDFHEDGILVLAGLMHLCSCLESLQCFNCRITSDSLELLLDQIAKFKSPSKLIVWNLSYNKIGDSGGFALTKCLPAVFPHLTNVFLQGNPDIGDDVHQSLEEVSLDMSTPFCMHVHCTLYTQLLVAKKNVSS